ncbi:MAG: hypothetical protein M3Y60_11650 [Bacteroidota bacterium]|nr:hypothetical protein [Bacteroidota bacterium]
MKTSGLLFSIIAIFSSCAPLFSDMQSARMVGRKQFEVTPGYTFAGYSGEGISEGISNFAGLQMAYGLSDNVDLRFRFEHTWLARQLREEIGGAGDENLVAFGPKINLARDRSALFLPISVGGGFVGMQPTFLFTIPVVPGRIDFNPSVKHLINICESCWQPLVALNAGFAFSSDITKWAIRPEYAVLYNLNAPGHYSNFSIGLSLNLTTPGRK